MDTKLFRHEHETADERCIDEIKAYNGQTVRLVRRLTDRDEVDEADMGQMFMVQASDGVYFNAFKDELS